jgi:sugar diacid utilization regulator
VARAGTAGRRELIEDLLRGTDPARLEQRAGTVGIQPSDTHVVVVLRCRTPRDHVGERAHHLCDRLAGTLVTATDDLMACVVTSDDPITVGAHVDASLGDAWWLGHVGIGRAHSGVKGIALSYVDAVTALDPADRLDLPPSGVHHRDVMVFRILGRVSAPLVDLVRTVREPLRRTRGGAQPLLDTLTAYFAVGNAMGAARTLGLSVRALTYRLARIHRLTGYRPGVSGERYILQTAMHAARLLGWLTSPLPSIETATEPTDLCTAPDRARAAQQRSPKLSTDLDPSRPPSTCVPMVQLGPT